MQRGQDGGRDDEIVQTLTEIKAVIQMMDQRIAVNTALIAAVKKDVGRVLDEIERDPDAGESELVKVLKAVVVGLNKVEEAVGRVEDVVGGP